MKHLLLVICAVILLTNCKKKNLEYELSGVVYDKSFNTPMANAEVTVSVSKDGSLYTLATVKTDNQGVYKYSMTRDKYHEISIGVSVGNYFEESSSTTLEGLSLDKSNVFDFNLYAKAWVKLHFVSDGTKKLRYFKQAGKSGCSECCESGEKQVYFIADTSIYCINDGNTPYQIFYDIIGGTDSGTKNVTTTAFDTTEVLINY